jgi:hypothetical protein
MLLNTSKVVSVVVEAIGMTYIGIQYQVEPSTLILPQKLTWTLFHDHEAVTNDGDKLDGMFLMLKQTTLGPMSIFTQMLASYPIFTMLGKCLEH